ncbi:MAG: DUF2845 domain-containing protein, partial [Aeromonas veronii]
MLLGLVALLPLTANAGAMRCKSALISDGDSSFNVLKSCGQPQMKEDIIDERLLDAPKIGELGHNCTILSQHPTANSGAGTEHPQARAADLLDEAGTTQGIHQD